MHDDERFMRLAIQQAVLARESGDIPFGAVIVQGGEVLVAAHNREHLDLDVTAHAETNAVREACRSLGRRDLSDCVIYATNEPCLMCGGAIFTACMPRVVYALSRDDLPHAFRPRNIRLAQMAADLRYTPEIVTGVLRDEALALYDGIQDPFRVTPRHITLM